MSSAANHRKRSHRSQRMHYNASNRMHRRTLAKQFRKLSLRQRLFNRLSNLVRRAQKNRERDSGGEE